MHKEKKFPITLTSENVVVLKESTNRHTSGGDVRFVMSYAINSDLALIEPCLEVNKQLMDIVSFSNTMGVSSQDALSYIKQEGIPLCYLMKDITYIAEQTVEVKNGEVRKSNIMIYLPYDVQANGFLLCRDVSLNFPYQVRKKISERNVDFVKERL